MADKRIFPLPVFGLRLRRLRRAKGVKQLALAQALGLDQATISRWESGHQRPAWEVQRQALAMLAIARTHDAALRRLVETSTACVHLVDEASHICLAYSRTRANDWRTSQLDLRGVSLWQFATDEIRQAEAELADTDWWSSPTPAPKQFRTSEKVFDEITISAGGILWERVYLADGTPARLVTGCWSSLRSNERR